MLLLLSEGYATSSRRKFLTIVSNATFFNKRKKKFRNATLGDTKEAKAWLPYWLCFQFLCGASLYLARTVHIWMAPIPVVIFAFIDILSVICWRGHWYRLPSPGSVRGYELIHKDCHWLFVFFYGCYTGNFTHLLAVQTTKFLLSFSTCPFRNPHLAIGNSSAIVLFSNGAGNGLKTTMKVSIYVTICGYSFKPFLGGYIRS